MSRKPANETPLYVRLPATAGRKLDRASEVLGIPKKDLVANLVAKYVDPDSQRGLQALGFLSQPRPVAVQANSGESTVGRYSFLPYETPEVMNAEQAAQLLAVEENVVVQMAEAGKLPGRKLGSVWRFSRASVLAWLGGGESR